MAHLRAQIRDALVTALTGLTTTAARVFAERPLTAPLASNELPCLCIYANEEASQAISVHFPPLLERALTLTIEARAQAITGLDDTLDTICAEVETALNASEAVNTLSGLCKGMNLTATSMDIDADAEQPVGVARMTWITSYYTAANAPQTAT